MKKIFLFSAFLTMSMLVHSQKKIEVETGEKSMSKGQQMAITIVIPEAKIKDIEPAWKRYINNRSVGERIENLATQVGNIFRNEDNQVSRDKLKVEKNADEFYVRSIEESSLTKHSMDVYARMTELPEGCQFSAFFQYTDSVFINESNADQERIESLKSFIRNFGIDAYRSLVDEQIKVAKKEVSTQEGVLKDIESDSRKEEKAVTRNEADIQEYNADIVEVENDIKRLDETIETKKAEFALLTKDSPDYAMNKTKLKELSREKSKNFSKIKSIKGKIKSKEMDIKSLKGKIAQNEIQLNKQQLVINDRLQIVGELEQKKVGIQ